MEPAKSYTCANCKETFHTGWSDAKAEKEYAEHFGYLPKAIRENRETLCDDCYRKFMKWMRAEWRKSGGKVTLKN
jgi:DNA-directed RNA polymerase subunit RPC12/RpoP